MHVVTGEELCELLSENDCNISQPRNQMFLSLMDLMVFPCTAPFIPADPEVHAVQIESDTSFPLKMHDTEESAYDSSDMEEILAPRPSQYESCMDVEFPERRTALLHTTTVDASAVQSGSSTCLINRQYGAIELRENCGLLENESSNIFIDKCMYSCIYLNIIE